MATRNNVHRPYSDNVSPLANSPSSRRTASVPNRSGTRALYATSTQSRDGFTHELRVLDYRTGTSSVFSADVRDREITWLEIEDLVVWLRDADQGTTELWVGDIADGDTSPHQARMPAHCAGCVGARATNLKVKRLYNKHDDVAVAVACPATANDALYNPEVQPSLPGGNPETRDAIWYTTLRKRVIEEAPHSQFSSIKNSYDVDHQVAPQNLYTISPSKFINALRGTGLSSPLPTPFGSSADFDLSSSGLVFVSRDPASTRPYPADVNAYYIPLKTFTELSRPLPQILSVQDFEGRSSCPVFSPSGTSVAVLKKKSADNDMDRNRVVVINHIREFRTHLRANDVRTAQSERDWHLSPYSVAWSESGTELYVVAIERGQRKLFRIPAAVSSIRREPEPITSESKTAGDVRHLRMVFSAPMDTSVSPTAGR